jgi:putative addiction module component (TIGR02574 family)
MEFNTQYRGLEQEIRVMTEKAQKLKDQLDALSEQDRLEIVGHLLRTVDGAAAVETAWEEELDRRWREIKTGTAKGSPIEVVNARLRENYS